MKIETLKLQNFRQYKSDEVEFDTEGSSINVIVARNGKGKSNILNAITWCLYNEEVHRDENEGYPLLNTSLIDSLEEGETSQVAVELEMTDDDGNRHNIERSRTLKKEESSLTTINEDFFYTREKDGDMKPVENPEQLISRQMPEGIKQYFFFDGEKIKDYVTGGSSEIEPAIRNVSQIDVLTTLKRHLNEMKGRIIDRKDEIDKDIQDLREEIKVIEDKIESLEDERSDERKKRKKISKRINELENKLKERPNVGDLQEERQKLDNEEETKKEQLEELKVEKLEQLFNQGPIVLAKGAIRETIEKTNEKIDKGEIPPKFKREYLEGLIEDDEECICGRDLEEEHKERLKDLLTEVSEVSELYNSLMTGRSSLKDTMVELDNNFLEEQEQTNKRIRNVSSRIEKINDRKDEIKAKLRGSNDDQIIEWEEELENKKKDLEEVSENLGTIESKIKRKQNDKKKADKEISKIMKKEERNEEHTQKYALCDQAEEDLEEIETEIIEEIRNKIEENTEEKFTEMMWKQDYSTVELDQNFSLSVRDGEGREALGSLSKGEKQTLAYSFTFALNEVSGFRTPFVVDSSLGRIDEPIDEKFAENLSKMIGDRQLILLAKNKDYRDGVRTALQDVIGKEYTIKFEDSQAEVIDYE